ncbi:MAG TPA: MBL fold metallo-hydrolase [Armatimonadota bacterium]|nr:MBL fold metallo-hydrolase [Armatimonadota bacterium]
MKIQWLGHSAFLITSDAGVKIVTDPYQPGGYDGAIRYGKLEQPVDIVTVSHEHPDHNYVNMIPGTPIIIKEAGRFVASGIEFVGVQAMHDESGGEKRGKNTIFSFTVDGVKVCHLGDLGHVLNPDQAAAVGTVDVLLTPIGGYFTIGPDEAWQVADQLSAKVVIPMHFKTKKIDFPIGPVEDFIKEKPNVKQLDSTSIEFHRDNLPEKRSVIVLKHAL